MSPFRIISVEPKQPARKRRTVKLVATAKPRPRRKAKPAVFANQAEEWAAVRAPVRC